MPHPPHTIRTAAWSAGALLLAQVAVFGFTLPALPQPAAAAGACTLTVKSVDNKERYAIVELQYPKTSGQKYLKSTITNTRSKGGDDPVETKETVKFTNLASSAGSIELKTPTGLTADAKHVLEAVVTESGNPVCSVSTEVKFEPTELGQCRIVGNVMVSQANGTAEVTYEIPGYEDILTFDPMIYFKLEGKTVFKGEVDNAADKEEPTRMTYKYTGLTEKRVYKFNITLETDKLMWFDTELCTTNFEVNMAETPPETPPARQYEKGGEGMFTWLTAECINLASEDVPKIEAISCVVKRTIQLALNLVGVVSTALVVLGGFILLSAKDDEGRMKGKKVVGYALTGLVIVLLAYVITQVITAGGIIF